MRRWRGGSKPGARRRPMRSPRRPEECARDGIAPGPLRPARRSAFSAAGSSAACWRWRRPARLQLPRVLPQIRIRRRSTWCSTTCADYADNAALERFADEVDVVTYEFENVPAEAAMILAARRPVLPDPTCWPPPRTGSPRRNSSPASASRPPPMPPCRRRKSCARRSTIGRPAVLKTRRFGYDGKGQVKIREGDDLAAAWREVGSEPRSSKRFVPFEREISVIAARGADGQIACFDVTENEHRDHILKISRVPAAISAALAAEARAHRRAHRERVRLCRRAGGRDVRGAGDGGRDRCW